MAKPGPKPNPDDVKISVGLKLHPDIVDELHKIAQLNGGLKTGTVARMLFMRGLLRYRDDTALVEPEKSKRGAPVYRGKVVEESQSQKEVDKKRRA